MEKKNAFMKMWECRDLGPISEYLCMRIVRDRIQKKLIIDQIDYTKKVVECFGQQNAKPTYTPLPVGYQPKANEGVAMLQHADSTLCIADTSDRPVLFHFTYRRFTLR